MSPELADLIRTTDAYGNLMPSYLMTPVSDEGMGAGLVEYYMSPAGRWQRLTAAGMSIKYEATQNRP